MYHYSSDKCSPYHMGPYGIFLLTVWYSWNKNFRRFSVLFLNFHASILLVESKQNLTQIELLNTSMILFFFTKTNRISLSKSIVLLILCSSQLIPLLAYFSDRHRVQFLDCFRRTRSVTVLSQDSSDVDILQHLPILYWEYGHKLWQTYFSTKNWWFYDLSTSFF